MTSSILDFDSEPHQIPSYFEFDGVPSRKQSIASKCPDRTDINMELQREDILVYQRQRRYNVDVKDWHKTMASENDHIIMLKILIAESKRQNKKGLRHQFYRQVMREATNFMQTGYSPGRGNACASLNSPAQDRYSNALRAMENLRPFSPSPLPPHIAAVAAKLK